MLNLDYESFSVYGFSINYPISWRIELDPSSTQSKGNVVFKSSIRSEDKIFLSWGLIQDIVKKYPDLNAFANAGIDRIRKTQIVKSIRIIETKNTVIFGHDAILNCFDVKLGRRYSIPIVKEKETVSQKIITCHFLCRDSGRYYILYGSTVETEDYSNFYKTFGVMKESLRCHTHR